MAGSDYPLQAMLYCVALHRFLRWRQPGYDPAMHIGGVLYLFVRGMAGTGDPVGGRSPVRGVRLAAAGRADHRRCPICSIRTPAQSVRRPPRRPASPVRLVRRRRAGAGGRHDGRPDRSGPLRSG